MYEVMLGDTMTWKVPCPKESEPEPSPESLFTGDGGPTKILKVCFCTNNNLGKNFKLVKCDSSWQIRVGVTTKTDEALLALMCALSFRVLRFHHDSFRPSSVPFW